MTSPSEQNRDKWTVSVGYDEAPIDNALWAKIEELLTYKQCEVVYLRNQGYTNREIASLCGISRKAVEKRFARIRRILNDFKEF